MNETPSTQTSCHLTSDQCKSILANQETLQNDVSIIKAALIGDEYHPGGGLVQLTRNNRTRLRKVEWKQTVAFGVGTVLITIIAFLDKIKSLFGG